MKSFRLTCLHVSFSQKAAQWRARNGLARFELPRAPQSAKYFSALFFLLAEIGFADFGGACGASFHFAPTTSKEKAANVFVLFKEPLFYQQNLSVARMSAVSVKLTALQITDKGSKT